MLIDLLESSKAIGLCPMGKKKEFYAKQHKRNSLSVAIIMGVCKKMLVLLEYALTSWNGK